MNKLILFTVLFACFAASSSSSHACPVAPDVDLTIPAGGGGQFGYQHYRGYSGSRTAPWKHRLGAHYLCLGQTHINLVEQGPKIGLGCLGLLAAVCCIQQHRRREQNARDAAQSLASVSDF